MNSHQLLNRRIGVALMSFYKPEWAARILCAYHNIKELSDAGIASFILDDSPDPKYGRMLSDLGSNVSKAPKGIGPSKREGVRLARQGGYDLILMSELEKYGLAPHIPSVMSKIADGTYDIVHFCRTEEGWASYPKFQSELERENAKFYAGALGITDVETDTWMGPVGFSADMADELLKWRPEDYGVADKYLNIVFPVWARLRLGARVGFVRVPWTYPIEQRLAEEGVLGAEMEKRRLAQVAIRDDVRMLVGVKPVGI